MNLKIEQLEYVFNKIPFYLEDLISNESLIKSRKEFFDFNIFKLNKYSRDILLSKLGFLCSDKFIHLNSLFEEEFKIHPHALRSFNNCLLRHKLEISLHNKELTNLVKL